MAKTPNIGDTKIDPNTYDTKVWDGITWVNGSNTITSNLRSVATNSAHAIGQGTITRISEHEHLYNFLKNNLRVAEYLDDKGKIKNVQLELRQGEQYVWVPIKRIKIDNNTPYTF
jgi:hypothetical protein